MQLGFGLLFSLRTKSVPEYLKEEFKDLDVVFIAAHERSYSRVHKALQWVTNFLIYTDSTRRYLKYGNKRHIGRSRVVAYAHIALTITLSKIFFLRPLMRWTERTFFKEEDATLQGYFDTYQPDVVFSTSVISNIDITLMKEARRRNIPTVSMPKGWDNVTRNYYRFVPDYFLVQNEILRENMAVHQDFPKENIFVIGFPQFDWYARPDVLESREEHLATLGLDPEKPYIFFASEGVWADRDHEIAEQIYSWIESGVFTQPVQLLVRPHFTNVKDGHFESFKGREHAVLDESFEVSELFLDNWDPKVSETISLANTLKHAAMLVTIVSTINLDAACYDKPLVNFLYGAKYRGDKDISAYLFDSNHMQWVADTKALRYAHSPEELKKHIQFYLDGNDAEKEGRQKLREQLCYKVDGKSSERMVAALTTVCDNHRC